MAKARTVRKGGGGSRVRKNSPRSTPRDPRTGKPRVVRGKKR